MFGGRRRTVNGARTGRRGWGRCGTEASCAVFGMPRKGIAAGAACEVVALDRVGAARRAKR